MERNHCTSNCGAPASYGILIQGDKAVVISNSAVNNTTGDIHFDVGTASGYAGGNITESSITDAGTNNAAGYTPGPNDILY